MIKTLLIVLLLFSFTANAQDTSQQQDKPSDTTNVEAGEGEKKVSKRDYSISRANSYSDLFFDSSALESFIVANNVNDTISRRMRSFYNTRNYQFAWFSGDGVTEQGRSFWNLHEYHTTYSGDNSLDDKNLKKRMNYLISQETLTVSSSDKSSINTELTLTQHFIQYLVNNYKRGEIKRKEVERFVPYKKVDAMYLADSILTKKHKDNRYYADINPAYKALVEQLQKYFDIAKSGGWQSITTAEKRITRGMSLAAVTAIKKRLQVTGEMPAGDTSSLFNDQLANAVKSFQKSLGHTADGVITAGLIREMNVPPVKRVQQLLLNMGRMRWMLNNTGGKLIMVNIPEFVLHVFEGTNKVFDMNVVVGKEGHNTTIFTGNLNQVVFSPYWNVTANIVKNEILPAIKKDPNYLSRNNMEQVGSADGLPKIRQLPGPKNSLGKVKFLFPNSFDIYFHDTPAKHLFNSDKRAYSHGCIRLSDPFKMATYILQDQKEWTPGRIDEAMNSGKEQYVKVKTPVPVLITYYTAWVDEAGLLNFRDDIYKHDVNLMKKMFVNPL
ncbi:MAG: L,D-transpeptidase family protein [Segetibacter sp.]|nr:L,D-transpeptidase family protein [Segetibacter sp.]